MGVYIKGMEMPKNCTGCPICCGLPYQYRDEKGRRPDCPLIELPPHGRLIDADELANYKYENLWTNRLIIDADCLDDAQTVIEAEGSET